MGKKAFRLDVDKWLGGTAAMTATERGAYIDLLCCQWSEGPLSEEQALSAGRADPDVVRAVLARKFERLLDGRFQNSRLEAERKTKPGPQNRGRAAFSAESGPAGAGQLTTRQKSILEFPCNGPVPAWILTEGQLAEWSRLYPGLDVLDQCRRALAWVQANGRKTAKGMPKFIVNWLNRQNDSSKSAGAAAKTFKQADREDRQRMLARLKAEQGRKQNELITQGEDDYDGLR